MVYRPAEKFIHPPEERAAVLRLHHVQIRRDPAEVCREVLHGWCGVWFPLLMSGSCRFLLLLLLHPPLGFGVDAVLLAVEDDRADFSPEFAGHAKCLIHDDSGNPLLLRIADHAEFLLIDCEAFLLTHLIDPPAEAAEVEAFRRFE